MTQRRVESRRYVALLGCLVLANFAEAQDVSTNEVLPPAKAKATANSTSREPSWPVVCPGEPPHALARILGVSCGKHADCQFLGPEQRCCRGMCRKGEVLYTGPIFEPSHRDFLGIRRKCPAYAFPENLPIKRCSKDSDCEAVNRICCPDRIDKKLYCRTASPLWSQLPIPMSVDPLKTLMGFVQCQAPPPPVLDIFSRSCNRTVDCLPNLCCQEGSKKVCRPAKRSVLSLAVQATSKFIKG